MSNLSGKFNCLKHEIRQQKPTSLHDKGSYICSNSSKEYLTCHKTGESAVATGTEGAEGVCVLMMYCSGAAYLNRKN